MKLNINSIKWTLILGIKSGYEFSKNAKQVRLSEEEIACLYRNAALRVEEKSGVYISSVIIPSITIYKNEWGCPKEGEYTYTLSGSCNPAFSDAEKYKEALLVLAQELRKEFKQSTVLLEMYPAEVAYFREED